MCDILIKVWASLCLSAWKHERIYLFPSFSPFSGRALRSYSEIACLLESEPLDLTGMLSLWLWLRYPALFNWHFPVCAMWQSKGITGILWSWDTSRATRMGSLSSLVFDIFVCLFFCLLVLLCFVNCGKTEIKDTTSFFFLCLFLTFHSESKEKIFKCAWRIS